MMILCLPAAASVTARLADSWPRTSAKSTSYKLNSSNSVSNRLGAGAISISPAKNATAWARLSTGMTSRPSTTAASPAFSAGKTMPRSPRSPPLLERDRQTVLLELATGTSRRADEMSQPASPRCGSSKMREQRCSLPCKLVGELLRSCWRSMIQPYLQPSSCVCPISVSGRLGNAKCFGSLANG